MPDLKSFLDKAKTKAEGFAKQHNIPVSFPGQSSSQQQHPPQGHYQPQPPPNSYPPPNAYPPNSYNPPAAQHSYPPPNAYPGSSYPQQAPQNHYTAPNNSHAPPIPQQNKPYSPPIPQNHPYGPPPTLANNPPASAAYWQPNFHPSVPVSQNFKHQLGAHGWGNNELQNYIADPANSFHTPDNKLILRAVSQNGKFTSARLTSYKTLSKQRGSLVTVCTPPCAAGIWPALWLLPQEPFTWPNEGEFDILETWNADNVNHSCCHWGHFNGEDSNKHRVVDTPIHDMASGRPIRYEFVWQQDERAHRNSGGGRAVWYIDGRAVMKCEIPAGSRRISDWQVIINVAMGGNVCQGKTPADGYYDFVVHELRLNDEPSGGWQAFERDWHSAPEGHH